MKFWAVLGSRGCREKKLPTVCKFFGWFFVLFVGKNFFFKIFKNVFKKILISFCPQKAEKTTPKSYTLMAFWSFFSLQPRLPNKAKNFIPVSLILLSNHLW